MSETTTQHARTPLTRERILRGALAIVDRDGLEALSMRRLGAELGVEAMSLYNHVSSKDELLEGVSGLLLQDIELPDPSNGDWTDVMKTGLLSFRSLLLEHPRVIPIIQSKPDVTPEAFAPIEFSLDVLRRAGFGPEDALQAHWALIGYTLGHVSFQMSSAFSDEESAQGHIALRQEVLPENEFPRLFEVLPFLAECDFDAGFEFGLDTLLAGLKQRLTT
ncbi:MAG: TetR/AcrR family transcriptional regulator C-terminal domain-containing protein [Actinomycetota bacterium]|nr:TetR/AcrR family transcriptional regulator C-terminal domain-containing protein [Actinomycetota bacterium]